MEEKKISEELLAKVKRKCYIASDENDKVITRLKDIISNAIPKLVEILGLPEIYDFNDPGSECELFLNYCFYAWHDQSNSFEKDYLHDIMKIRAKYEVEAMEDEEEQAQL